MTIVACLPVAVTLGVLALRRSTLVAASAGLAAALLVSAAWFPVAGEELGGLAARWSPLVLEVLVIVLGGLLLSEAMRATGRQDLLARRLSGALGAGPAAALAVVHGVTPFAESVTGFGIGVTLSIPLLLQLGFSSRRAATIGLLGLCAVPWGSMGPGTLIAADLSHLGLRDLGVASAIASGPLFLVVGLVVAWISAPPGRRTGPLVGALASGATLWAAILGANLLVGTAPAGAVGALVTFALHLTVHRVRDRRVRSEHSRAGTSGEATVGRAAAERSTPPESRAAADSRFSLLRAVTPYVVLLGGVLATTAALAVLGVAETGWRHLASPAVWLIVAVFATTGPRRLGPVLGSAGRRWLHVGPANGLLMLLGIVMAASGMARALAEAAAHLGPAYALVLGGIGALGGYLTGSNSAANAMFAAPQSEAIGLVGLPHLPAMAVHNVCSSMFLMASPAKIELAAQLCPDPAAGRGALRPVLGATITSTALLTAGLVVLQAVVG